jgi:hypothetical protein
MKTKICTKCKVEKQLDRFDRDLKKKSGYAPACKDCEKLYRQTNRDKILAKEKLWRQANKDKIAAKDKRYQQANRHKILVNERKKHVRNPRVALLSGARRRARKENLPFNLEPEDIYIPKYCPYINIPLAVGGGGKASPNSPSLDRIDPNLGYIKGNVITVSHKANSMKRDATPQEIISLGRNLKKLMDKYYPLTLEHIKKISPQPYTPPLNNIEEVEGE